MGRDTIRKLASLSFLTTHIIMYAAEDNNSISGEDTRTEFSVLHNDSIYFSNNFTLFSDQFSLVTRPVDTNLHGGATEITQTGGREDNCCPYETTVAVGLSSTLTAVGSVHLYLALNDCMKQSDKFQVSGTEGSISMTFPPTPDLLLESRLLCEVELVVPRGMVANVRLENKQSDCFAVRLRLYDDSNDLMADDCPVIFPKYFFTYSRTSTIVVEMRNVDSPLDISLNFTAIPETDRPQLHINFTSSTTGELSQRGFLIARKTHL